MQDRVLTQQEIEALAWGELERRRKIAEARRGRPVSAETRRKMSESAKRTWAQKQTTHDSTERIDVMTAHERRVSHELAD